ncbi:hypothetical protein AND_010685 [Anopheles darlingi]|uniref:DH domain-containing protein n=1 Tax=Anopheles darlingi TaxID=43151 RepID=W5J4I1_ANODA|nr:hypothetical protein AND_010685 [Anopheles darlingi]
MTSKPEPADKLGRNMKALPANCQKLADGIQQSWNRAIPENDYIQLGTLRYGVRLSNTGLLEDAMATDRGGKAASDHQHHHHRSSSRGSSNGASYDHFSNGSDGGGGSRAGSIPCSTGSGSSEQPAANCCCIRASSNDPSSNVEIPPWTNSYGTRTKLPVPATGNGAGSLNAKNRKSSPSASTASTVAGGWGGLASPATSPAHHQHQYQQQQQQQSRHLHLAPNRTTNGHALSSPSTQSYGHGSEDGPSLGYSNGHTNNNTNNGGQLHHHHNNNNNNKNNNGYHNNRNGAEANEEPDQQQQQQETSQTGESTSPRCSAVVCCYGNSFGTGTITGSGRKKRPTNNKEHEPQTVSPGAPHQHHPRDIQRLREHRDAGVTVTGGGADRRALHRGSDRGGTTQLVRGNASVCVQDDDEDADVDGDDADDDDDDVADDDVSALVAASQQLLYANGFTADATIGGTDAGGTYEDDGGRSSGSFYRFADGDLNLNPRNAPQQQQHQQQQQQVLQRWQSAPSANAGVTAAVVTDRRELNINNFEKKQVASTEPHYGQSFVASGSGRHAVEPNRSASPNGSSPAGPDWSVVGGRGRTLQPPSSLPVKSYSFHRDRDRTAGGGAAGQLFDRCSPLFEPLPLTTGRNRSFRNAQHTPVVRRSSATVRHGTVPDEPRSPGTDFGTASGLAFSRTVRQSPPGCGAESEYPSSPVPTAPTSPYGRVNTLLTRKSSLPVLSSERNSSYYHQQHHQQQHQQQQQYPVISSSRASIDECYPFDKSTCQPECILTPRSHRKQPCSDALNEIRLQSLNKYCNQLLLAGQQQQQQQQQQQPFVASPRPGRRGPSTSRRRPHLDELEDELGFIDSSDLSSAGDEQSGGHNGLIAITSKHPRRPTSHQQQPQQHQQQQQHSSIITHGTVRIAAAIVVTGGTLPAVAAAAASAGDGDVTGASQHQHYGRNIYNDSSSDELSSVCSGVEQLTRACASVVVGSPIAANTTNSSGVGGGAPPSANGHQPYNAGNASNGSLLRSFGRRTSGTLGSEQNNSTSDSNNNNNNKRRHRFADDDVGNDGDGVGDVGGTKHTNTAATVATPATAAAAANNSSATVVNGTVGVSVSVATDVTGVSGGSSSRHQQQSQQQHQPPHVGLNCFGRSTSLHAAPAAAAAGASTGDKSIMEKRSNTLDRLQRFVKKSTSSANAEKQQASGGGGGGGQSGNGGSSTASTKTERLRELTELLTKGGSRGSSVPPAPPPPPPPPPIPPPRRAKQSHSIDRGSGTPMKATTSTTSLIDSILSQSTGGEMSPMAAKNKVSRSVDLPYRFADSGQRMSTPSSPQPEHKPQLSLLRANVSTSNLEVALHDGTTARPLAKGGQPSSPGRGADSETTLKMADDEDQQLFVKLSRPESRTIVGSYTQKTIPFRSASFSQVDYSSGKYIRSALGALKNSLLSSKGGSSKDSATVTGDETGAGKLESTARSCSPTELCGGPTTTARYAEDTDVAKLTIKKTELSINLMPMADDFGRLVCDDRLKRFEGKDLASNRNSDIETIVEDPVAEHVENVENPAPAPSPPPPPPPGDEEGSTTVMVNPAASINVMQASEMVLVEPPVEEGIPITPCSLSKDDECLQQATTCLIPVPVYDCVVSEWSTAKPSEQWIDASMTEYSKFQDCLGSIKEVNESAIAEVLPAMPPPSMPESSSSIEEEEVEDEDAELPVEKITIARPPQIIEPLDTTIDLSEADVGALFCTPPVSIICTEPESNEFTTIIDGAGGVGGGTTPSGVVSGTQHKVSVVLDDGSEVVEVVEVRKRHSNNEDAGGDTPSSRHSNELDEKRRLESRKSRRKGIYIQWPAIDGNGSELEPDGTTAGAGAGDGSVLVASPSSVTGSSCEDRHAGNWTHKVRNEKDSSLELSGESFTDLSGREDGVSGKDGMERPGTYSPDARYRLDPTTPDSDTGRNAPVWPVKGDAAANHHRRQSLTYQSSDEKDDTLALAPAATGGVRSLKSTFLRSDSVSDCESDRASSRDRTSASPAPGAGTDADLKRYSKRPLRGPYGQMLEAEMKKPTAKVQYNEILEELTRNESHGSLTSVSTTRSRGGAGSQSMDETNDRHTGGKSSGKPRKTSANLPVPTHVRTASSPSKLSDSSSHSTGGGGGGGSAASRRHLSHIEQRSTDSDRSEKSGSGGGGHGLGGKKFSLDSHHHAASEKVSKRASEGSGGMVVHEKHHGAGNKRSCSSASDKQPKRSLDEVVRLSQNSRTPSERSIGTLQTPEMLGTSKGMAASPELLAELLKGSSEKLITEQLTTTVTGTTATGSPGPNAGNALPSAVLNCLDPAMMPLNFCSDSEDDPERTPKSVSETTMWHNVISCYNDTRTHVVVELFNTEKSYVESLQTIVLKYLNQLKSPDNAGLVGVQTVDEIFFMVPAILNIHERFLEELRRRLDSWDKLQMIGDAFVDVFSRPVILDTYTAFVNNWNRAKDAIRSAREKCPAFARFLEAMAREHKGKLSLDNLLIKPVQKFPNYELIFTRLIKHTDVAHPDQKPLQEALKLVHDILMFLNCKEKEALENGQRETALRELEGVIEGMNDLVTPDRAFLLFDLVSMPSGQVTRKERGFFLFNDLLVITSIKRRSGTIRKTNMTCPGSVASTLDTNKYKYLTKIALDDLEIVKCK